MTLLQGCLVTRPGCFTAISPQFHSGSLAPASSSESFIILPLRVIQQSMIILS
jgi:hypothetical protein